MRRGYLTLEVVCAIAFIAALFPLYHHVVETLHTYASLIRNNLLAESAAENSTHITGALKISQYNLENDVRCIVAEENTQKNDAQVLWYHFYKKSE